MFSWRIVLCVSDRYLLEGESGFALIWLRLEIVILQGTLVICSCQECLCSECSEHRSWHGKAFVALLKEAGRTGMRPNNVWHGLDGNDFFSDKYHSSFCYGGPAIAMWLGRDVKAGGESRWSLWITEASSCWPSQTKLLWVSFGCADLQKHCWSHGVGRQEYMRSGPARVWILWIVLGHVFLPPRLSSGWPECTKMWCWCSVELCQKLAGGFAPKQTSAPAMLHLITSGAEVLEWP